MRLTLKNINADNTETKRMFVYSAIKIKAKEPDPYSVLNPETNSDSPSAKSKGVRFVSASKVKYHIKKLGINSKNNIECPLNPINE